MMLSCALFGSGIVDGQAPAFLIWPAFVITGSAIGAHFAVNDRELLSDSMKAGLGGITLARSLSLARLRGLSPKR